METNPIIQYLSAIGPQAPFVIAILVALGTQIGKIPKLVGQLQFWACFAVGFVIGGGYALGMKFPTTSAEWVTWIVTAALFGLVPSGIYEAGKAAMKHSNNEQLKKLRGE